MNKKMLKAALAGLVLSVSGFANAGLITGVGSTLDSIGGGSLIDFTGISGSYTSLTIDNVTFISNGFSIDDNFNGNYNMVDRHFTDTNATEITFQFDSIITAFSFIHGASDNITSLSAYNGVNLIESFAIGNSKGSNDFKYWGLSNSGMTSAVISFSSADYIFIDNFAYKSVDVPEPSTLAILALGIMGLASRRFKKQ